MSDLSPFLHPTEPKTSDDLNEMNRLTAELANKFAPSYFEVNNDVTLTDEELDDLRDLAASDATQLINYLDPLLREKQDSLNRQVEAIESIASQARNLAQSTAREANILKEQLEFAKSEAESAKKEALFAKATSIIAILISIAAIVVPIIIG